MHYATSINHRNIGCDLFLRIFADKCHAVNKTLLRFAERYLLLFNCIAASLSRDVKGRNPEMNGNGRCGLLSPLITHDTARIRLECKSANGRRGGAL